MSQISEINKTILKMSKKLTQSDVNDIKLLYQDKIGEGVLEKAQDARSLLKLLKELDELDNLENFCAHVLDVIDRSDISDMVLGKEDSSNDTKKPTTNSRSQPDELSTALLEFVADKIAGDWRRLARKLGHEENFIEQIDLDYRKTLEKAYQIVSRWKKDSTQKTTWEDLKSKLQSMPRHDIVRDVEAKFPKVLESNLPQDPAPNSAQASEDSIFNVNTQVVIVKSKGSIEDTQAFQDEKELGDKMGDMKFS